jgi:Ala-tRNA(Pro) deacylase
VLPGRFRHLALGDRHCALGAPRFSFGSPELLYEVLEVLEVLGVRPRSVTPFAAINDSAGRVAVVLQRSDAGA